MQLFQCYPAVLFQFADALQPFNIERVGTFETDMANIKTVGFQHRAFSQILFPVCQTHCIGYADQLF